MKSFTLNTSPSNKSMPLAKFHHAGRGILRTPENKPKFFYSKQRRDDQDETKATSKTHLMNGSYQRSPISDSSGGFYQTVDSFHPSGQDKKENGDNSSFVDMLGSKYVNQKAILSRSYQLSQLRKRSEGNNSKDKLGHVPKPPNSPKQNNDKTVTRLIDNLILSGTLPLDAAEYFSPTNKNIEKEIKGFGTGYHSPSKSGSFSKPSKPGHKRSSSGSSDIVPEWMQSSPKYSQLVSSQKKESNHPLYRIFCKKSSEWDLVQHSFVAKWLSEMQLFSTLPYDKLLELAKVIEPITLTSGQVLCSIGDLADSAFIIYDGQLDILAKPVDVEQVVGKANPGDILGRNALESLGKRTAKLQANRTTYLVSLRRYDYLVVLGGAKNAPVNNNSTIHEFITHHYFLNTFSEVKKHTLIHNLTMVTFIKNEVIYPIDAISDRMYIVMSGKVVRRMPVTVDKANKWPTGLKDWRICKIVKTYAVTLPIEVGEIFGVSEMIAVAKRKEHVLVEEDAKVLILTRDMFYQSKKLFCQW